LFIFAVMNFSSKLLEEAVNAFASLPGIGKKTALRLVLHLLNQPTEISEQFATDVLAMRKHIKFCNKCHNISDGDICTICADPRRDESVICVVESIRDVMAIEETAQFKGRYHVLGGVISPIQGIGPSDLNIDSLIIFYISKKLKEIGIHISTIARGVSFGGELEYADEMTLGRSIVARVPYKK